MGSNTLVWRQWALCQPYFSPEILLSFNWPAARPGR